MELEGIMEIKVTKKNPVGKKPDDSTLGFGNIFTDHMFNLDYNPEKGWHNARIEPFQKFEFSPATMVLHYGQAIFEGLKAYKNDKKDILLFRVKDNFKRLNHSAKGLCIPELDSDFLIKALHKLLKLEKDWVPEAPGTSLYIRPAIIATDPSIDLRPSETYRYFVILSPVGAYYEGFKPVKIWVSKDYTRAIPGGVGEFKTAGNYAASLFAATEAAENGYDQVLWLDAVKKKYIEEVGSMNIFFAIGDEIVTPKLTGSILPGITRSSVIDLSNNWGFKISERRISIDEILEADDSGDLKEVFGTGTGVGISPVGGIGLDDTELIINGNKPGELAVKFNEELTGIKFGNREDKFNWVTPVL